MFITTFQVFQQSDNFTAIFQHLLSEMEPMCVIHNISIARANEKAHMAMT